ncbi:hypothetical protein ACFLYQ_06535 [Chloroflexota bacterium]
MIRQIIRSEYLKLVPILALAFYVAFIPHLSYPYALHVDEWVHLARSGAMIEAGSASIADTLSGGSYVGISANLEAGYQLFWGVFQSISGIHWMDISRYFPSVVFMITVLSVYVMAKREGFGPEAAFFTCLIPTTVGVLGPAFLVPVSMGLLFTPLILFLAFSYKTIWSYLLIFILICFLLAIHAPSAICPIIVLFPYILLNIKGNFRHSLGIILALLLPFFIIFPWIFSLLLPTVKGLFAQTDHSEYVLLPRVIEEYGYMPIVLCLLGIFSLAIKGGRKRYGLVLGLLAIMLMLVCYYSLHYGVWIMYERGLTYMMLMMGIIAGAGLVAIRDFKLPEKIGAWMKMPFVTQYTGKFVYLVLIVVTLVLVIPARLDTSYYYMIDEEDYQAFAWIQDNLGDEYGKAVLDPWKATAFSAITGKTMYSRIHAYPMEKDKEAYSFIRGSSTDTDFLKENGISVVYTRVYDGPTDGNIEYDSNNPDLVKVAENIYLLKENDTSEDEGVP